MRSPLIRVSRILAVTLLGLVFFGAMVSFAAPAESPTPARNSVPADSPSSSIVALRRISIPFGVNMPLQLSDGGDQVEVTGHGTCPDGAETFWIRTTVTQDTTGARAMSRYSTEQCDGSGWHSLAEARGPTAFDKADLVQACVMVLFRDPRGPTTVFRWCYDDVPLE